MIHKANETCILKVQPPDVVILQHIRKNNIRIASIVNCKPNNSTWLLKSLVLDIFTFLPKASNLNDRLDPLWL